MNVTKIFTMQGVKMGQVIPRRQGTRASDEMVYDNAAHILFTPLY